MVESSRPLLSGHEGHRVGADIAGVGAAQGEEAAVRVEGQLHGRDQIARLVVGEEHLAPVAGPLNRAAEAPGRPDHKRVLGVGAVAGAVVAAHVLGDHSHAGLGHAQHLGEIALETHRPARARVEGDAAGGRVVNAKGDARFHRHAGDARHPGVEPHHVSGRREGSVGGERVARHRVDAHVAGEGIPELRRAAADRVAGGGHRRQVAPSRCAPARPRRRQGPRSRRPPSPPPRPRSAPGRWATAGTARRRSARSRGRRGGTRSGWSAPGDGGCPRGRRPPRPVRSAPRARPAWRARRRGRSIRSARARAESARSTRRPGRID